MSTGYTSDIVNDISFEKFVLRCARAFGALITMREDPWDDEIPDEFIPSDYHKRELIDINSKLKSLKNMSMEEINRKSSLEYIKVIESYNERQTDVNNLKDKYLLMLIKVKNWNPPTIDHQELKRFMIQQIEDSIKFDCNLTYDKEPICLDGKMWLKKEVDNYLWDINYHIEQYKEEVERCEMQTKWVKQLKESLYNKQLE